MYIWFVVVMWSSPESCTDIFTQWATLEPIWVKRLFPKAAGSPGIAMIDTFRNDNFVQMLDIPALECM